jgi:PKD repeat protein
LDLVLRNTAAESVEVNSVNVSDGDRFRSLEFPSGKSISVSETGVVTLAGVSEGDGANSLDVTVNYDSGVLSDMEVSGTVSGGFEITESGSIILDAGFSVNDSSPNPGDTVEFTSDSTPETEISSYSWSSPDTTLDEASGKTVQHTFTSTGDYQVNLTVSDGEGNQSSHTETVEVTSSTGSPADFRVSGVSDDGPVTEDETVTVDYTVSNEGDVSSAQDVTLDVSGVQEDVDSSVSLSSGGSTTGALEWVTETGDSGSGISYTVSTENDSVSGTVDVNALTGPTASASVNNSNPVTGEAVEFDGSSSSPGDGSIDTYEWDVDGDGNIEETGETVTHSYSSTGTYSAELKLTDSNGLTDTDQVSINVDSNIPDSGPYQEIKKEWFENQEDSQTIWDGGFDNRDTGNVQYSFEPNGIGGDGLRANGKSSDNSVYKQSARVDLTDYSIIRIKSSWNHDPYSEHGVFIDAHSDYDSNNADVVIADGDGSGSSGTTTTDIDVSSYSGIVWIDLYVENRNFYGHTADATWNWIETIE